MMKKQLLIALLTFIPFFATAKPNKTELLAHLTQAKIELENKLLEFSTEEKIAKQEWAKVRWDWNYYIVLKNIWNDITELPEHSNRRKALANFYFDQICNHKKSINEIAEMKEIIEATVMIDVFSSMMVNDKKQKKQEKILDAIIEKHAKKYAKNFSFDREDLGDEISLAVGIVIDHNKMVSIVLNKINEKIKTLE